MHNGKSFIDCSVNMAARYREHVDRLDEGTHPCKALQFDYTKYGKAGFVILVIDWCETNELIEETNWYLTYLRPAYNESYETDYGKKNKPLYAIKGRSVERYDSLQQCSREIGLSSASISAVLTGKQKTSKGYTFKQINGL